MPQNTNTEAVTSKIDELRGRGAVPLTKAFRVAGYNQADLSLNRQSLFVTPNDEGYHAYRETMLQAGLPYIENTELGSDEVVVGKIPGDARNLPRIIRPRPNNLGLQPKHVFEMLGQAMGRIAEVADQQPSPINLDLDRILFERIQSQILFIPSTLPLDQQPLLSHDTLMTNIDQQLEGYTKFGSQALLSAFRGGFDGYR